MVVLSAVCAAVYAATMIPFKVLVIFPGLAEVRPAAVFPVVFSFLFGPAGAWGAAFGNVVGDMLGGMLGPGSLFGFLANFAYGYIPYKLWEALYKDKTVVDELISWQEKMQGLRNSVRIAGLIVAAVLALGAAAMLVGQMKGVFNVKSFIEPGTGEIGLGDTAVLAIVCGSSFIIALALIMFFSPVRLMAVMLVACLACAGILGWAIELLGFFPFQIFGIWILANNFAICTLLAPPLILLLYPRVANSFMTYGDLLEERESSPVRSRIGAAMVIFSVSALFLAGILIGPDQFAGLFGSSSALLKGLAYSPFVLTLFFGLFLL
jgi:hypothetical protein